MSLNILQFGTTGQLATELLRQAPGYDVVLTALSRRLRSGGPGRRETQG